MKQHDNKPVPTDVAGGLVEALRVANKRYTELQTFIDECDMIIVDCQHYLELYDLNASEQMKITGIIRETLRNKRCAQDERSLISGAKKTIKDVNAKDGYQHQLARITGERSYKPKIMTLAQAVDLKA